MLKPHCGIVLMTVGLFLAGGGPALANLIMNGDFEGGVDEMGVPNNWQWFGIGNDVVTLSSDTPSGGGVVPDYNQDLEVNAPDHTAMRVLLPSNVRRCGV